MRRGRTGAGLASSLPISKQTPTRQIRSSYPHSRFPVIDLPLGTPGTDVWPNDGLNRTTAQRRAHLPDQLLSKTPTRKSRILCDSYNRGQRFIALGLSLKHKSGLVSSVSVLPWAEEKLLRIVAGTLTPKSVGCNRPFATPPTFRMDDRSCSSPNSHPFQK